MQQIECWATLWVAPIMSRIVPVLSRDRPAGLPKSVAWFLSDWSHHLNEPQNSEAPILSQGLPHPLRSLPLRDLALSAIHLSSTCQGPKERF